MPGCPKGNSYSQKEMGLRLGVLEAWFSAGEPGGYHLTPQPCAMPLFPEACYRTCGLRYPLLHGPSCQSMWSVQRFPGLFTLEKELGLSPVDRE